MKFVKCIVRSNFRMKEPLYVFMAGAYLCREHTPVLGIYCFLYYFQQRISQAPWWGKRSDESEFRGRDHLLALLSKAASQGLMAWACCPGQSEVWRFTSTPPTLTSSSLCHTSGGGKSSPSSQWLEGGNAFVILPLPGSREPLWT